MSLTVFMGPQRSVVSCAVAATGNRLTRNALNAIKAEYFPPSKRVGFERLKSFQSFRLDTAKQCLLRGQERVPMPRKPSTSCVTWSKIQGG